MFDLTRDDLDDGAMIDRSELSGGTVRIHVARMYVEIWVDRCCGAVVREQVRGMRSGR